MGYWKIWGLGELVRLTLNYLKLDYEDEQFETPEQWFPTKFNRGIPFVKIPFIVDGEHKQTETSAIIEYLCHKYKPELLGTTPEEKGTVAMLRNIFFENMGKISGMCYATDSREAVTDLAKETFN